MTFIEKLVQDCDTEIERLESELIQLMVTQTHIKKLRKILKKGTK